MYVRVKFGFLLDNLNKAIPISRKKMEYASHMEKNGWFSQPTYTPIEEDHEYWLHYMSKVCILGMSFVGFTIQHYSLTKKIMSL